MMLQPFPNGEFVGEALFAIGPPPDGGTLLVTKEAFCTPAPDPLQTDGNREAK
jgi:hypothetical protein